MPKKINVEDLYVEDIVKGMAKSLNVLYYEDDNITKVTFPETIGSGFLKATQFASGLGIIEASYFLKDDLVVNMDKQRVNPLKFLFNLGESFYHKFGEDATFEEIEKYSGAIVGSSTNKNHTFKIPKEKEIYIFSLELNRNLFEHKLKSFKFDLGDDLETLLRDVRAINPFFFSYLFGIEVFEMIQKITTNTKTGFIGSLYKEGVTYSLLSDTLETYLGKNNHDNLLRDIPSKEKDLVLEVSSFIDGNLEDLPTIDILAKDFYISETKLQKLFNAFYNCTVNDFIKNKRLNVARELLEKSNLTIAEVSEKIGIRSNSYFTKLFKERYGITPSSYRHSKLKNVRFY